MQLRTIPVGELEAYLASPEYKNSGVIPITAERAISQIANPRTQKIDPALILAEEANGNVLGFIGLLPDLIFNPGQQKVFWISCWWIHPEKGKSLGVPLLFAAYKASEGFLLADSIPETLSVFQKSKLFTIPEPKAGLKLFLQPLIKDVVIRKKPALKQFAWVLGIMDFWLSLLFMPVRLCLKWFYSYPKEVVVSDLTENGTQDIPPGLSLFHRTTEIINWILNKPWVTCNSYLKDKRYYPFSHAVNSFKHVEIRIYKNGILKAYLHLTIRDSVAKLMYADIESESIADACKSVMVFLYKMKVKEFISFHAALNTALNAANFPTFLKHPTKYQYVWGKPLGELDLEKFQFGDGDAIFT